MITAQDQAATLRELAGERSSSVVSLAPRRRRVLAVTGGKGGVGKSTIALNLAVSYSMRGSKTVALDGDLAMADLNLLLGVAPKKSILDVLDGASLDEVLVEAHGIHLLPALNGHHGLADLPVESREMVLDQVAALADRFETTIVDTSAGIGKQAMGLASSALEVVVVATPEPLSLADAYACIKVLAKQHGIERALLVPNNVLTDTQANEVHAQLSALVTRFLGIDLVPLPAIPHDPNVQRAAAEGVPMVLSRPDAPASRAIQKLSRAIDTIAAERGEDR